MPTSKMSSKKSLRQQKMLFSGLLVAATAVALVLVGPQLWQSSHDVASQAKVERVGDTLVWTRPQRNSKITPVVTPVPVEPLPQDTCNKTCTTNAQCGGDHVCFNSECRLAANPTDETCSPPASPVIQPSPTPLPSPIAVSTCPEDINYDYTVNMPDFEILKENFGKQGDEIMNRRADINQDDRVTITDFSLLASAFGRKCGPSTVPTLPVEPGPGEPVYPIE